MRHPLFVSLTLIAVFLGLVQAFTPAQAPDPWEPFHFLLGRWTADGSGEPGKVTAGTVSFTFDLEKKILIRKNRTEFAPKPGEETGLVHEDLLIVYPKPGGSFRAIYFDNEGHVIQYAVSFPAKQPAAVFESDAGTPGPRFRLTYTPAESGGLSTDFSFAPPGGEFKSHVQGTMKPVK